MLVATGVLAAACGSGGAPAHDEPGRAGSVPACMATAVQALDHHVTLTTLPASCRGLSRAHLNLALGRAIYEVAGAGQHKAAWRRRAAAAQARLPGLIESLPQPAVRPRPVPPPPPAAPADRWGTGLATLATWLLTMGLGACMLVPWIRRRGLHPPRAAHCQLGPVVTLGHAGVAGAGLLAWIAYLVTGSTGLGWLAVGILLAVIGLGMATLTAWTAQTPRPGPVSPHRTRGGLRIIIPIVHGLAASATILLALLTVVTAR